jgi:phosphoribosylglycinamide formyltransferase 1
MSSEGLRVGVLVSGSGTNLASVLEAAQCDALGGARVVLVLSNRPRALALERAGRAGVKAEVVDHKAFADRPAFETALVELLAREGVELVVLAGFMRLLGKTFLDAFGGRIINIHPALLPSFPGVDGQGQALDHGVRITGCTVHFVDEGTDTGPIIAQAAVPVLEDDDEHTLRERILMEEHRLLPQVIRWIAEGRVERRGRRVRVRSSSAPQGVLRVPVLDEDGTS